MTIPTRDELIESARHQELDSDAGQVAPEIVADFALAEIRRAVLAELERLRREGVFRDSWKGAIDARIGHLRKQAEHVKPGAEAAKIRAPKPVDVFEAFHREWHAWDRGGEPLSLDGLARDWFGSTVAYVQTMAARPCVQPGKDCGHCDSCEARLDVAHLRQRAEEASRGE